jgi:hypothetical protein
MISWCSYKTSSNVGRSQRILMPERLFLILFFSQHFIPTCLLTHNPQTLQMEPSYIYKSSIMKPALRHYSWNLRLEPKMSTQSCFGHQQHSKQLWWHWTGATFEFPPEDQVQMLIMGWRINQLFAWTNLNEGVLNICIIGWLLFSQITGNWNFWGWQSKFPPSYFEEENPLLLQDLADNLMSLYHSQELAQKVFMSLPELSFWHPLCPYGVAHCPGLNLLCSILKDKVINFLSEFSWALHWYRPVRYWTTCNMPEH